MWIKKYPAPDWDRGKIAKLSEGFWFDLRVWCYSSRGGLVEKDLAQRRDEPGYFALVDKLDVVAKMGTALEAGGAPHRRCLARPRDL